MRGARLFSLDELEEIVVHPPIKRFLQRWQPGDPAVYLGSLWAPPDRRGLHGHRAPLGASSLSGGSSHTAIAPHALVDAGGDTAPSGVAASGPVTNQKITVGNLPTGVTVRLYRQKGSIAAFYLVAQLPNNVSSTYTDNLPDGSVGRVAAGADPKHSRCSRGLVRLSARRRARESGDDERIPRRRPVGKPGLRRQGLDRRRSRQRCVSARPVGVYQQGHEQRRKRRRGPGDRDVEGQRRRKRGWITVDRSQLPACAPCASGGAPGENLAGDQHQHRGRNKRCNRQLVLAAGVLARSRRARLRPVLPPPDHGLLRQHHLDAGRVRQCCPHHQQDDASGRVDASHLPDAPDAGRCGADELLDTCGDVQRPGRW